MSKKVLIVEDSISMLYFEDSEIKKEFDFETILARTKADAIKAMEKERDNIFVALLDLNLPDAMNGEIVDSVLEYNIPSIVFSAIFSDGLREKLINKGVVDYVLKGRQSNFDYVLKLINRIYNNRNIKALVVDDSKTQRVQIKHILKKYCFNVIEANDGLEAFKIFEKNLDIKLIITDHNMPNMTGIELVEKVRFNTPQNKLAIIAVSSNSNHILTVEFLKKGANDFLVKPFANEELICRVNQNMDMLEYIDIIKKSSITDFLTGLYNRKYFFENGEVLFNKLKSQNKDSAIAMIDIDFFKRVNDTYGHNIGDLTIKHISTVLKDNFRSSDVLARFGGEEFCVIVPNISEKNIYNFFDRIRDKIENSVVKTDSKDIKITVSIGVTSNLETNLEDSIKEADKRLYLAKQNGRNRVEI